MVFEERSKEREAARERVLVARLEQFIEDSDLSFYKIASRVGTSGGILSMWLAGTTAAGGHLIWRGAGHAEGVILREPGCA